MVLTGFLLVWSAGVLCGGRWNLNLGLWLSIESALLLMVIPAYILARWGCSTNLPGFTLKVVVFSGVFIPCFPFGILFTQFVTTYARSWGHDVGRYFAFNTFGSCLGIVIGTLVGFEFRSEYGLWIFAGVIALLAGYFQRREGNHAAQVEASRLAGLFLSLSAVMLLLEVGIWKSKGGSLESDQIVTAFYGRGGVVEVDGDDNLAWDRLWHSRLSRNDDHVGTNNWRLAVIPLLCHPRTTSKLEVCVVGLGTGITAGTLSRSNAVAHIDVFEINKMLRKILEQYPDGTLHTGTSPKIQLLWQDGRTGLALREKQYDLITQQPLYLQQAGSSILLSREYMELVKSRLSEAGVFCIYCNAAENDQPAAIVRRTARSVFRYCESFGRGYMIVASESPIRFDEEAVLARLSKEGPLRRECESFGIEQLCKYRDATALSWDSPFLVTDDHPLVEYSHLIRLLTR